MKIPLRLKFVIGVKCVWLEEIYQTEKLYHTLHEGKNFEKQKF